MTLETYGLPEDQFIELFQERSQFYFRTMRAMIVASLEENVDINGWPHAVVWKMFESISYDVINEARLIQKKNNPEMVKEGFRETLFIPDNNEVKIKLEEIKELLQSLKD